jgi:hypothetical protein
VDPKRFWDIIAAACQGDGGDADWDEGLRQELAKLPADEILAFAQRYEACVNRAYRTDLWGAAYLINGGCSDDGFHYFRCWLVGMGKKVYETALANPDSLAGVVKPGEFYHISLSMGMREPWQARTGKSEGDYYAALDQLPPLDAEPAEEGEDWDFDDNEEMRERFPRLAALFLDEAE